MHKIKEYYENNGKNNYEKFLDYIKNKPRCLRSNPSIHLNIKGLDHNIGNYGRNESAFVSSEENCLKEESIKEMHVMLMKSKLNQKKIIKKKDIEKFLKTLAEQKSWSILRRILNTGYIDKIEEFKYNHDIDELAKIITKYLLKNRNRTAVKKFKHLKN